MKLILRLVLLVAALAYGAMPMTGMSAMAMPVAGMMTASTSAQDGVRDGILASSDCPHAATGHAMAKETGGKQETGKTTALWHCSACLTLPADLRLHGSGPAARAAQAASPVRPLVSRSPLPLTPPPRA